jgi:cytoskeletal protein CcmA (bactofilin family)
MPSHVDEFFERYLRRAARPAGAQPRAADADCAETQIHGDVDGDVVVEPGAALRINGEVGGNLSARSRSNAHVVGDIGGDVIVEPGARLRIDGDLGGNIFVRSGGAAYVAGEVGGDATIDGALMIAGGVGGDFVVRPGGEFTNRGVAAG